MNITLAELKAIMSPGMSHSFVIGETYLIRTVTFYYTGRLAAITETDIVMEDAAWIVDTGRFHDALKVGTLSEVEPFIRPLIISRGGIVDATVWVHDLPREQT